jgi:hypothetical protein
MKWKLHQKMGLGSAQGYSFGAQCLQVVWCNISNNHRLRLLIGLLLSAQSVTLLPQSTGKLLTTFWQTGYETIHEIGTGAATVVFSDEVIGFTPSHSDLLPVRFCQGPSFPEL